jgi:hypothetical protein
LLVAAHRPADPYTGNMADERDEHAAERERSRDYYSAMFARVAAISPETRDAEVPVVREVAAAGAEQGCGVPDKAGLPGTSPT